MADEAGDGKAEPGDAAKKTAMSETDRVKARKKIAGLDENDPSWGIALGGGGIRSATFCLGLLRALAGNDVLRRFDYMSTVSGGGYAGAAVGRLFKQSNRVAEVQEGIARDDTLFLWWLRSNGRYLTPHGARDLVLALASYLRGVLATQLDAAMFALAFALAAVLPHLVYCICGAPTSWRIYLECLPTLWWWFATVPVFFGLTLAVAYFHAHDRAQSVPKLRFAVGFRVFACVLLAGHALRNVASSLPDPGHPENKLEAVWVAVLLATLVILVAEVFPLVDTRKPEQQRVSLTNGLAWCLNGFLVFAALGALDFFSWLAHEEVVAGTYGIHIYHALGILATLLAGVRAAAPLLSQGSGAVSKAPAPLKKIGNFAGLLVVLLLIVIWLTLFQCWVFDNDVVNDRMLKEWDAEHAYIYRYGAALFLVAAYLLMTRNKLEQLNWSSLHPFYRSRLARAYVSVGNAGAEGFRFPQETWLPCTADDKLETEKVTDIFPGDDLPMAEYEPHRYGGPIHLVNCCINQTIDDRTGNFNADRKGVALTVSSMGIEIGAKQANERQGGDLGDSTLAQWVAISGAAVGAGMGSNTESGLAAMLFLSGFRLGYWWRRHAGTPTSRIRAAFGEMFAKFPGLQSNDCYLSDGGHFDNTGVYALLKRQLPLIVLADCGADPQYRFGDVDNLVRKARIDYGCEIDFVDPEKMPAELAALYGGIVGTPQSVGSAPNLYLLLARLNYADAEPGVLIIVKPRRLEAMSLDVASYAENNPAFPQQSTTDQFFDEARWESYERLGWRQGKALDLRAIADLATYASLGDLIGVGTIAAETPKQKEERAGLLHIAGKSIGIGALVSALLAGWQVWSQDMKSRAAQQVTQAGEFEKALGDAQNAVNDPGKKWEAQYALLTKLAFQAKLVKDSPFMKQWQPGIDALSQSLPELCSRVEPPPPLASGGKETDAGAKVHDQQDARELCSAVASDLSDSLHPRSAIGSAIALYWSSMPTSAGAAAAEVAAEGQAQDKIADEALPGIVKGCLPPDGGRLTLYIQIYSEEQRAAAQKVQDMANRARLSTAAIENVSATAKQTNSRPPFPWHRTAWLYHGDTGKECAKLLDAWYHREFPKRPDSVIKQLSDTQPSQLSNLELWMPGPEQTPTPTAGSSSASPMPTPTPAAAVSAAAVHQGSATSEAARAALKP